MHACVCGRIHAACMSYSKHIPKHGYIKTHFLNIKQPINTLFKIRTTIDAIFICCANAIIAS